MAVRNSAAISALNIEMRISKYETNSKNKTRMFKTAGPPLKLAAKANRETAFEAFEFRAFGFVSDFDIRILMTECRITAHGHLEGLAIAADDTPP